jgi:hypothetical protein
MLLKTWLPVQISTDKTENYKKKFIDVCIAIMLRIIAEHA